jgi:hypothetical protein
MIRAIIVVVLIWAALMPPFFTNGACDAEFNQVSAQLTRDRSFLGSPEVAAAYFWRSDHLPVHVIAPDQCPGLKPWFVESCGRGELLYVAIPVHNTVCHIYRDAEIRVQLQYDENKRLQRQQSDMKPYKYFRLPWLGINWYWGR